MQGYIEGTKRKWQTLLLALAVATLGLVAMPASAHHGGDNQEWGSVFTIFCAASHRNSTDPIVGGSSHLHQYFGSTIMSTSVTETQIEAGGSSCRHKGDTAGYWIPALTTTAGTPVTPDLDTSFFYYYCRPVSASCVTGAPMPDDLKFIWGQTVGDAIGGTSKAKGWKCGTTFYNRLVNCSGGLSIEFQPPNCWDGRLDSPNHREHMAYDVGGTCPASHPTKLAVPTYFINWKNVCVGANGTPCSTHKLASDGAATPGSTLHADFWNTWNQPLVEKLSRECTIEHQDVPESINDWGCRLLEDRTWTAQTAPVDYGFITNGGFENGMTGWAVLPAGSAAASTSAENTGANGARVTFTSTGTRTVYQTKTVAAGETVCVSGNFFPQSNYGSGQARLEILPVGSGSRVAITPNVGGRNGGGLGPGEFKHVWAQGTVPAGVTQVRVGLYAPADVAFGGSTATDGLVFVDDISFFRSACPASFGS